MYPAADYYRTCDMSVHPVQYDTGGFSEEPSGPSQTRPQHLKAGPRIEYMHTLFALSNTRLNLHFLSFYLFVFR